MNAETEFSPGVEIMVPAVDSLSGIEITVSFVPVLNSHDDCSTAVDEVWVIAVGGTVARPGAAAVLVDRPQGQTIRCQYDVMFQVSVAGAADVMLASQSPDPISGAAGSLSASAVYVNVETLFEPEVAISAPVFDDDADGGEDFLGVDIKITFSRLVGSNAGCTETASEVRRVSAGGAATLVGSSSPVSLVNRPEGVVSPCAYAVEFEVLGAAAGRLVSESGGPFRVSAAVSATVGYVNTATMFSPAVEVTVPAIDDLSGTEITVGFAPVNGSNVGCTETASEVWLVGTGGAVARPDGQAAATLVDRPQGADSRCQYTATFPDTVAVSGRAGDLVLISGFSEVVSGAATAAAGSYESSENVFSPEVAITGPAVDRFDGTEIRVSFVPVMNSHTGCSTGVVEMWRVSTGGNVVLQGSAARLVDRPQGQTTGCEYTAVFPRRCRWRGFGFEPWSVCGCLRCCQVGFG